MGACSGNIGDPNGASGDTEYPEGAGSVGVPGGLDAPSVSAPAITNTTEQEETPALNPGSASAGDPIADTSPASAPTAGGQPAQPVGSGATPVEAPRDPGNVTLHRLNRAEYNNTVRDLFYGLEVSPADAFPADDQGEGGFNNNARALSIDSVLLELHERSTDEVLDAAFATTDRAAWMPCATADTACARQVLEPFAARAWRRPLEAAELDRLAALVAEADAAGLSGTDSLKQGMKAVLVSPHFLFRVELDPDPASLEPHSLSGFELASRLSYFLWSSMPDEALFTLAESDALMDPTIVAEQVERMLADPKADALAQNFAAQWLRTRDIGESLTKDADVYPDFDDELRESMRTEIDLLLSRFISEKQSVRDLLLAEDTFVDDRLAELYGLPPPGTGGFELVSLAGVPRRGLLTTAGLQAMLAYPEKTSPVVRGVWVLEELLCIEPPPPPDSIEIPDIMPDPDATTREELEQHRADPACTGCHQLMDPIGLAFENYDAMGVYREVDGGQEIDASGQLPDGQTFANALEMLPLLADHPDVQRCVTEKAMTYALGRGLTNSDDVYVEEVSARAASGAMSIEDLAKSIATSDAFMMRRGEEL
jgi:hypothetical protein